MKFQQEPGTKTQQESALNPQESAMNVGYVDTTCLIAISFDNAEANKVAARLQQFDVLVSSCVLEAELRSTLEEEGISSDPSRLLDWIQWLVPERPLTEQLKQVLQESNPGKSAVWHLACGLYLSPDPEQLVFLTLDDRQAQAALKLGFQLGFPQT